MDSHRSLEQLTRLSSACGHVLFFLTNLLPDPQINTLSLRFDFTANPVAILTWHVHLGTSSYTVQEVIYLNRDVRLLHDPEGFAKLLAYRWVMRLKSEAPPRS